MHGCIFLINYEIVSLKALTIIYIFFNCNGKKIIVSKKIAKFWSLAVRAITIFRPSSDSVNVLEDRKECIRLAVKSIFTTESPICGISKRRLGKHSSPNEIAPRWFLQGILHKRSRKRSLQFNLSFFFHFEARMIGTRQN